MGIDNNDQPSISPVSLLNSLQCGLVGRAPHKEQKNLLHWAFKTHVPGLLSEKREFKSLYDASIDKVFSSVWVTECSVLLGTKDDRLILLNTINGAFVQIPLLGHQDAIADAPSSTVVNWTMAQEPSQPVIQVDPNAPSTPFMESTLSPLNMLFNQHSRGIHAIALHPSKTLVAVGQGGPSNTIHLFHLPSFQSIALLNAHQDKIFGLDWASDTLLVSVGRDGAVIFWDVSNLLSSGKPVLTRKDSALGLGGMEVCEDESIPTLFPSAVHRERGRQRAIKANPLSGATATLSSEGFVKLWDSQTSSFISHIPLENTLELVSMASLDSHQSVWAIGSQSHITLIDGRSGKVCQNIASNDEGYGVRSLAVRHDTIITGGGMGRLSFFNLTAGKYHQFPCLDGTVAEYKDCGDGWISPAHRYNVNRYMDVRDKRPAILTMALDDAGVKLLTGGGPIHITVDGSYAGLWSI